MQVLFRLLQQDFQVPFMTAVDVFLKPSGEYTLQRGDGDVTGNGPSSLDPPILLESMQRPSLDHNEFAYNKARAATQWA